jgi:Ca2+-binding RTX toxin-like protein
MKATLCVTNATTVATIDTACGARDDGAILVPEMDQIANVEHVIGGTGDDTMTAAATATDTTFEGGSGMDTLTGGGGNDNLWGDAGNDILSGGAGDDNLDGGGGTDSSDGGADGDVCVTDTTTPDSPRTSCELG